MKWTFPVLLAAGLLIRAAALPLPGTGDFGVWRVLGVQRRRQTCPASCTAPGPLRTGG